MPLFKKYHDSVYLIQPEKFKDNRGEFMELFNIKNLKRFGLKNIVQINYAKSKKNVLRGMHIQIGKYSQGKLLRVINGSIFDVIINLDKNSRYFKKKLYFKIDKNNKLLWIPRNYAHGYLTLKKGTEIEYICDNKYNKISERTIIWNDDKLNINWPKKKNLIFSKKDIDGISLREYLSQLL
mgnify:CR=1 FL=1